jgi:hypothetical protein
LHNMAANSSACVAAAGPLHNVSLKPRGSYTRSAAPALAASSPSSTMPGQRLQQQELCHNSCCKLSRSNTNKEDFQIPMCGLSTIELLSDTMNSVTWRFLSSICRVFKLGTQLR